jgi:low temperature requirement protein LtrA
MSANSSAGHPLLRHRDGHHARVTFEELLFDLVYVFAVTQLSHGLLHHLTLLGVVETLIMCFAVWLGWQYTCWVTKSHLAGMVLLLALVPLAYATDLLMVGTLTTLVLLIVCFVEWRVVRRFRAKQAGAVIEH